MSAKNLLTDIVRLRFCNRMEQLLGNGCKLDWRLKSACQNFQ